MSNLFFLLSQVETLFTMDSFKFVGNGQLWRIELSLTLDSMNGGVRKSINLVGIQNVVI